MNIKNYTSTVDSITSMAKIEKWLVEVGAHNVNKLYKDKQCIAITFLINDSRTGQTIAFSVKAQQEECFNVLWAEVKRPTTDTKARLKEQALRTAWKIISDWVEIQCTMIILGQAEPLQMFLPFVYDPQAGETLYEKIVSGKANLMLGPGK